MGSGPKKPVFVTIKNQILLTKNTFDDKLTSKSDNSFEILMQGDL